MSTKQITQIVLLDSGDGPNLEIGIVGSSPSTSVFGFNGSTWEASTSRIFLRRTGDPAPVGLALNDIVFQQNF